MASQRQNDGSSKAIRLIGTEAEILRKQEVQAKTFQHQQHISANKQKGNNGQILNKMTGITLYCMRFKILQNVKLTQRVLLYAPTLSKKHSTS